ncbi:RING finger [Lecanosticta acicola]|uniref:RING finger n=1 Tax=Lecanosticta acicola TaxID=111012 RepID=A0AAI8YZN8_9PEZI|nr:RING finger [Lecanosticta acicola]
MSSSIFFRFKSQKDPSQINFDGTSLSVFEVKREIMSLARLGDGKDFDLDIYASDTNEIYDDDTTQIPRSTTVVVQRMPAQRPGAGRAARYVTGQMPLHARNRIEKAKASTSSAAVGDGKALTEEEKLQAVLNASNNQMQADLKNSSGKPVFNKSYKPAAVPDKPLPPGYMCHRCGKAGHWIQACPTNNDPNFDGKHKFKRTTGIPKSFHVAVDVQDAIGEDGVVDPTKLGKGVMYTGDGTWVRAKTDEATWQKIQDQQKANAERAKEAAHGDQELRDRGLECPLDKRPFVDPVKTTCCDTKYCKECLENALIDSDLQCPNCNQRQLIDDLEIDQETVKALDDFNAEKKAEKAKKDKEGTKTPEQANTPKAVAEDGKSPAPDAKVNSPPSSNSKKRPAEDELGNNRQPANPAEIKKTATPASQTSQSSTPQPPTGPKIPSAPKSMSDFVNQMNSMAGSQNGMNAFVNPMMGMPMGMPMMPGMMPGFNPMMMGGMPFPGMNMNGMNGGGMGMNNNNNNNNMMNGGGMNWNQNQNNHQQQQQTPWMRNGTPQQQNGGGDGAYFRQPVNPHRHQGKQKRQRSVDYKQM